MPVKPISARAMTVGYAIALLIIAGLSVASHAALEYSLQSNEGSAAIINKSGRQRMLSQRIASLAAQYKLGDASARDDLISAIGEFEAAHEYLVAASRAGKMSNAEELQRLYFESNDSLDTQVRNFIVDARQVVGVGANDPRLDQLLPRIFAEARAPLLTSLNAVVTIEQRQSEERIVNLEHLQWAILAIVLATLMIEASVIFRPMIRRIVEYTAELMRLATTDSLTGAANRRTFMERSQAEIARARRYDRPASLLMIDLDHFKSINDTYGHAAGDAVLAALGDTLRQTLRQIDIWGRLGGEEFAVLLAETPLSGAAVVAERIRERFADLTVPFGGRDISFTVSIGCTSLEKNVATLDDALRVADELMYQAKRTGRNRVVLNAVAGA